MSADAPADYKDTVFLPETAFPMRGELPRREPEMLARWKAMDLYRLLRKRSAGRKKFVLHDGPPYANGNLHIGHALNKILKDVINRVHQMKGEDANYVFVREFAAYQVGSKLEPSDKRCIGVRNALNKVPHGKSRLGFQARYTVSFTLPKASETSETCEAPVKLSAPIQY